jgi:hypothetical protein
MQRLNRVLMAASVACSTGALGTYGASAALAQPAQYQSARSLRGSITGVVSDDRGGPIAGALVSALGTATTAKATTDATGWFSIEALPIGDYTLQAHRKGFAGSSRATVRVSGFSPSNQRLQLRRLEIPAAPVATSGTAPVAARPIMAAGIGLPRGTLSDQPDPEPEGAVARDGHPHSEMAWRLRHNKRSILKDASSIATLVEQDDEIMSGSSLFGRAMGSAASLATTFFTDMPFSGEVNLLTTSAVGPEGLFSGTVLPRGVAYLAIGAPTPAGDWSVRAAMSQGDLSSWIVAGGFQSRGQSSHAYNFGLSYSTQDYLGGNPAALAAATNGSRNVGEVYALDRWAITSTMSVEYGGRYGKYDYLDSRGLFSPRVGLTLEPLENTRVSAVMAQRMVAPGAEEFVANKTPGPWLPPERTFAPLGGLADADANAFSVERARSLDLLVEHEFASSYVIGVRRFYQNVDNQLVTLFGLNVPGGPQSIGHYYVANAGSLGADGWALRVSRSAGKRITGSVDYSVTRAKWLGRGDMAKIAEWAPAAIRAESEDLHDVTTSLATEIPETATRVFVFYKVNTGYTRSDTSQSGPGLDARFDVQVNQALPFDIGGTKWEVLLGLRNLFRDPNDPASVYDELLVVKPPKRVVGGFLVRF